MARATQWIYFKNAQCVAPLPFLFRCSPFGRTDCTPGQALSQHAAPGPTLMGCKAGPNRPPSRLGRNGLFLLLSQLILPSPPPASLGRGKGQADVTSSASWSACAGKNPNSPPSGPAARLRLNQPPHVLTPPDSYFCRGGGMVRKGKSHSLEEMP